MKYNMTLSIKTMSRLLKNTLLYGEYKGVHEYVEPYISKERFDRIQEIAKRNVRKAYNPRHIYLFAGMIRCPLCGYTMSGNNNGNRNKYDKIYGVYRCNKYKHEKLCTNKLALSENKIEKQMLANLEQYIENSIAKVSKIEDATPSNNNEIKVRELQDEMNKLNIMFRKNRISEEEYDTEYFKLEKKLEKLTAGHVEPQQIDTEHLRELLESNWKEIYDSLDQEHKRAFWHGIIKEFKVGEDRKIIPDSIIFF